MRADNSLVHVIAPAHQIAAGVPTDAGVEWLALDTLHQRQQLRASHQLDGLAFSEGLGLRREIAGGHNDDGGGLMVRQQAKLLAHDRRTYALSAPVLALDQSDLALASQHQVDPAGRASLTHCDA